MHCFDEADAHRFFGRERLTVALVHAFKMALDEHNNRAGNVAIAYEDMDDGNPVTSVRDAQAEVVNPNRALSDPSVMVYLGLFNSGAAAVAIPLLCQGNLAMISPSNTDRGLTEKTQFSTPNEPEVYYRNCQRNYTRVVPTDEMQGVVAAGFAKQLGGWPCVRSPRFNSVRAMARREFCNGGAENWSAGRWWSGELGQLRRGLWNTCRSRPPDATGLRLLERQQRRDCRTIVARDAREAWRRRQVHWAPTVVTRRCLSRPLAPRPRRAI